MTQAVVCAHREWTGTPELAPRRQLELGRDGHGARADREGLRCPGEELMELSPLAAMASL